MTVFGVWLWQGKDQGDDAGRLRAAAVELGPAWPIASAERADYEVSLARAKQDPERAELLAALGRAWSAYEAAVAATGSEARPGGGWSGLAGRLLDYLSHVGVWGVALGGLVLLLLFARSFNPAFLQQIATIEAARGLITFLFAVATVGIAVIVVLAAFLGNGSPEELAERFQRGKDVLTILIGVFGAILGFYFGSDDRPRDNGQLPQAEQPAATNSTPPGTAEPPANAAGDGQDTGTIAPPAR